MALIIGASDDDLLTGTSKADTIEGLDGDDTLYGDGGANMLTGDAGNDTIDGGAGADLLYGGDGDDSLYGGVGADTLYGGAGDDIVMGARGLDVLYGGAGADAFVFTRPDATAGAAGRDTVADFSHAEGDKIDLSRITIHASLVPQFTHHAGELVEHAQAGGFLISGDFNGDGKADFSIFVQSSTALTASDFIF